MALSAWEKPQRTKKEENPEQAWGKQGGSWVLAARWFKGHRTWNLPSCRAHSEHRIALVKNNLCEAGT